MPQGGKTAKIFVSAAIFIILEVAALAMLSSSSSLQNIWLNRASHRVLAFFWGGGEKVRQHFRLDKQNEELALENARLKNELMLYKAAAEAKDEAAHAAVPEDRVKFNFTPASIVKMSRNSAHNYIILNKGSEDGIKPNSGIISTHGVLGIVTAVDKHHSYGLSVMNNNISVSVRIGQLGIVAPMSWNGRSSHGAVIDNIPPHHSIAPGDTVWTSGHSSIFPADIPLGITEGTRLMDGSTMQVDVNLFQDFRNARYVSVVENLQKNEIEALEASQIEKNKKK